MTRVRKCETVNDNLDNVNDHYLEGTFITKAATQVFMVLGSKISSLTILRIATSISKLGK